MTRDAAAVDEVLARISDTLRPHCRLSEESLRRVSEAVLLLGARHALEWVERGIDRERAVTATVKSLATLGSEKALHRGPAWNTCLTSNGT